MRRHFLWTVLLIVSVLNAGAADTSLPRSTPEQQGISSTAITEFITAANKDIDSLHSFMLVRHGQVIAEGWWSPYDATTPHIFFSLSKSFTSTAVGIAIAEGKMTINDQVIKAFPDYAPAKPSNNLQAMRVRDLLRMSTGHQNEERIWNEPSWIAAFFKQDVAHKPGTHFRYNSPGTFMLSAMVQQATGQTVYDYLGPRLFEPLGFVGHTWMASPEGISAGAFGLMARTEDIARFGQLYLQKGKWHGKQLIPAAWVEEATSLQTSNGSDPNRDWDQGYGYQFWRCRHNAYRGDGAFGQYCVVMPDQDAVIAITGGMRNMQTTLDLVWQHLLPAMQPAALPANEAAHKTLTTTLAALVLPMPAGQITSPLAEKISGTWYTVPENDRDITAVSLDLKAPALVVRTPSGDIRTALGLGTWSKPAPGFANGMEHFLSVPKDPTVCASAAWTSPEVFSVKLALNQTPFTSTMTFTFTTDNKVVIGTEHNVNFGPTKLPELIATAQ